MISPVYAYVVSVSGMLFAACSALTLIRFISTLDPPDALNPPNATPAPKPDAQQTAA